MKVRVTGKIVKDPVKGGYEFRYERFIRGYLNRGLETVQVTPAATRTPGTLDFLEFFEMKCVESSEPVRDEWGMTKAHWGDNDCDGVWFFRSHVVCVNDSRTVPRDEAILRIKHAVLREEKAFSRMARELAAFENMERLPNARRERIPDSVRLFVWQRDEGKCVQCGSSEKLHFDHIIPVAKGGANTERNIQLLCEACNLAKGVNI